MKESIEELKSRNTELEEYANMLIIQNNKILEDNKFVILQMMNYKNQAEERLQKMMYIILNYFENLKSSLCLACKSQFEINSNIFKNKDSFVNPEKMILGNNSSPDTLQSVALATNFQWPIELQKFHQLTNEASRKQVGELCDSLSPKGPDNCGNDTFYDFNKS